MSLVVSIPSLHIFSRRNPPLGLPLPAWLMFKVPSPWLLLWTTKPWAIHYQSFSIQEWIFLFEARSSVPHLRHPHPVFLFFSYKVTWNLPTLCPEAPSGGDSCNLVPFSVLKWPCRSWCPLSSSELHVWLTGGFTGSFSREEDARRWEVRSMPSSPTPWRFPTLFLLIFLYFALKKKLRSRETWTWTWVTEGGVLCCRDNRAHPKWENRTISWGCHEDKLKQ